MKPVAFDYVRPASVAEACARLADDDGARVLAGGQSLIPMLAMRLARPTRLVDVARLSELGGIREEGGDLVIGAATRQWVAEHDPLVAQKAPLLARALPWVGHAATRRRGTVGGSIANADPAAEIPLVAVALGASIVVRQGSSLLRFPAGEFFLGPMITAAPADGLLTEIRFPVWRGEAIGSALEEVSVRRGDFAIVAAAAQVALDAAASCTRAAVAIAGAADVPVRLRELEERLVGSRLEARAVAAAVVAAVADLATVGDLHASADYRKRVAAVLVRRAILGAAQAAGAQHAR
jgi:CO/xanthine dehydrogenase FAD-binding subunit